MTYTKFHADWHNEPDGHDTPITAEAMEWLEAGIAAASASLVSGTGAVLVASSDAPAGVKAVADYVCDGTADQVQVQSALDDAAALHSRNTISPSGALQRGKVQLTGGRFNFSGSAECHTGTWVDGMGPLTQVMATTNNDPGLFTLSDPKDHLVWVSNMYLEGNGSSGGSCDAINFNMTDASPSTSGYPDTNPDGDHHIFGLYVHGFSSGTRNGINLNATGSHNSRGHIVHDCQVRVVSGTAVAMSGASDSFVHGVHVGGANVGFDLSSGNMKASNCKAYYCDTAAFQCTGSRMIASNLEAQDSATGFVLSSSGGNFANLSADTFSDTGIKITAACVLMGANVVLRSAGRYSSGSKGFDIGTALTDLMVMGKVDPTNITTPVSGSAHATRASGKILNGTTSPFSLG